ncbi:MAG: Cysteine-tRNA ligase [Parcubacteria group bacterium GW2011_GWC2_39_14]|nr:MAG: Cysteine-tRNA ligase [Parcubacteria group bacterium GW2011_GWC2_39_14]KKR54596.1 MAG: Cysteine-tRNA ligase [Parcubacteria group bacterium GW2011_GWA2_40_23]
MLRLFNTLSRTIEDFKPQNDKEVTFYACGPTVYDFAHIGNLRTFILGDILKRVLVFNGYNVKHVINITDVGHLTGDQDLGEDKIEKSARLESKSAWDIAEFYTKAFKADLEKLNIVPPTIWAKATDHISEQIELIKQLETKGFIYKISDGLYFDTAKFPDYGKLARLNLEGQEEGARVEANNEKKNPTDFAVWKFSPVDKQRQMEWDSPWGKGFPGWHLECSAMSMKYLGETVDIHAGGIDLIPVHHTNEIAQSESASGKKFVNYWVHGDFVLINENRMSKSEGNFITLTTLEEKGYDPLVYRFYSLSAHYRSKLNFSFDSLDNARQSWRKLKEKFLDLGEQNGIVDEDSLKKFQDYINDDLSMPQAMAVVWDVFKSSLADSDKRSTLLKFDEVLGLGLNNISAQSVAPEEVKKLVQDREVARIAKKWTEADQIRKKVLDLGWIIEDETFGPHLKKID